MSKHTATVRWDRHDAAFVDRRYSRAHVWHFDGGVSVPASSSPHSVRVPYSDPANVDPEEAFVAALASCHMLWFLDLAARRDFVVDAYTDDAVGVMGQSAERRLSMTRVTLAPHTVFSGPRRPSAEDIQSLHHEAHERCYLANSVTTVIEIKPTWETAGEGPADRDTGTGREN